MLEVLIGFGTFSLIEIAIVAVVLGLLVLVNVVARAISTPPTSRPTVPAAALPLPARPASVQLPLAQV